MRDSYARIAPFRIGGYAMMAQNLGMQGIDFLSAGVLVVDAKKPVPGAGAHLTEAGNLKVISEADIWRRPPIQGDSLEGAQLGGCGNVALPAARLGVKTGVIGYVGTAPGTMVIDPEGDYFFRGMQSHGIDISGIVLLPGHRTDVSCSGPDIDGKRAPLNFYEDAGRYFGMRPEFTRLLKILMPQIVQLSYSGLLSQGGDRNGGQELADLITFLHDECNSLGMLDTHTYKDQLELYDCLLAPLSVADMFVCSNDEVDLISPRFGIKPGLNREEKTMNFLSYLDCQARIAGRPRLYAVTSKENAYAWMHTDKQDKIFPAVPNWFTEPGEEIFDRTGAGDSWRAGLNAYILNHRAEYEQGILDVPKAVQFANLTARLYISGPGTTAFGDYSYDHLLNVAKGPRPEGPMKTLADLHEVIEKCN